MLTQMVLTVTTVLQRINIITGNCVKIDFATQQVDQVARELPDAGTYSRWNTKAL